MERVNGMLSGKEGRRIHESAGVIFIVLQGISNSSRKEM